MRNSSFEEDGGWNLPHTRLWPAYVGPFAFPNGGKPHSLQRAVRLGATEPIDPPSYSSASQVITLPLDARTVTLEYWVWTFSQDPDGGDRQEVFLLDPEGRSIQKVIWRAIPAQNARRWERHTFDLTPYRGRRFLLYFNVFNDGDNRVSAMFLDDVRVWACYTAPPAPTVARAAPPRKIHIPDLQKGKKQVIATATPTPRPASPFQALRDLVENMPQKSRDLAQETKRAINVGIQALCLISLLVLLVLLFVIVFAIRHQSRPPESE